MIKSSGVNACPAQVEEVEKLRKKGEYTGEDEYERN